MQFGHDHPAIVNITEGRQKHEYLSSFKRASSTNRYMGSWMHHSHRSTFSFKGMELVEQSCIRMVKELACQVQGKR